MRWNSPANLSVYGSPAQSPALQFFTPATAVAEEGAAASPSWISPVPLERWNAITDHMQHLRQELEVAALLLRACMRLLQCF